MAVFVDNFDWVQPDEDIAVSSDWTDNPASSCAIRGGSEYPGVLYFDNIDGEVDNPYICSLHGDAGKATVLLGGTGHGGGYEFCIACRIQDDLNYFGLRARSADVQLYSRIGGTYTNIIEVPEATVAGDTLSLEDDGSGLLTAYRNDVVLFTHATTELLGNPNWGMIARSAYPSQSYVDQFTLETYDQPTPTRRHPLLWAVLG